MTIGASSGTAPGPITTARNSPGGHGQAAPAGAVTTRAGLRRYAPRDLWALAAAGIRVAGALAAVGAAAWLDFFFTLPYYRLTIRSSDDVTTAVLLLVTGLAVPQLAAWARRLKVTAVTGEGYLATMHGTAALDRASRSPEALADYVEDLLAGLQDLQEWRFEYGSLRSFRRGWSPTAASSTASAPGISRRWACPPTWNCGCSATASITAGS